MDFKSMLTLNTLFKDALGKPPLVGPVRHLG